LVVRHHPERIPPCGRRRAKCGEDKRMGGKLSRKGTVPQLEKNGGERRLESARSTSRTATSFAEEVGEEGTTKKRTFLAWREFGLQCKAEEKQKTVRPGRGELKEAATGGTSFKRAYRTILLSLGATLKGSQRWIKGGCPKKKSRISQGALTLPHRYGSSRAGLQGNWWGRGPWRRCS